MGAAVQKALYMPPDPKQYDAHSFPYNLVWIPNRGRKYHMPALFVYHAKASHMIVYLHGNACDLGLVFSEVCVMSQYLSAHILAVEYPGYGLCPGRPSEASFTECLQSVVHFITTSMKYPISRVVFLGRSLGTASATRIASILCVDNTPPAGLILISPFTSIKAVVSHLVGTSFFVGEYWDTLTEIYGVTCSTMIIHGMRDALIPYDHSKQLYDACPSKNKRLHLVPDADHNEFNYYQDILRPILSFLARIAAPPLPGATPRMLAVRASALGNDVMDASSNTVVYSTTAAGCNGNIQHSNTEIARLKQRTGQREQVAEGETGPRRREDGNGGENGSKVKDTPSASSTSRPRQPPVKFKSRDTSILGTIANIANLITFSAFVSSPEQSPMPSRTTSRASSRSSSRSSSPLRREISSEGEPTTEQSNHQRRSSSPPPRLPDSPGYVPRDWREGRTLSSDSGAPSDSISSRLSSSFDADHDTLNGTPLVTTTSSALPSSAPSDGHGRQLLTNGVTNHEVAHGRRMTTGGHERQIGHGYGSYVGSLPEGDGDLSGEVSDNDHIEDQHGNGPLCNGDGGYNGDGHGDNAALDTSLASLSEAVSPRSIEERIKGLGRRHTHSYSDLRQSYNNGSSSSSSSSSASSSSSSSSSASLTIPGINGGEASGTTTSSNDRGHSLNGLGDVTSNGMTNSQVLEQTVRSNPMTLLDPNTLMEDEDRDGETTEFSEVEEYVERKVTENGIPFAAVNGERKEGLDVSWKDDEDEDEDEDEDDDGGGESYSFSSTQRQSWQRRLYGHGVPRKVHSSLHSIYRGNDERNSEFGSKKRTPKLSLVGNHEITVPARMYEIPRCFRKYVLNNLRRKGVAVQLPEELNPEQLPTWPETSSEEEEEGGSVNDGDTSTDASYEDVSANVTEEESSGDEKDRERGGRRALKAVDTEARQQLIREREERRAKREARAAEVEKVRMQLAEEWARVMESVVEKGPPGMVGLDTVQVAAGRQQRKESPTTISESKSSSPTSDNTQTSYSSNTKPGSSPSPSGNAGSGSGSRSSRSSNNAATRGNGVRRLSVHRDDVVFMLPFKLTEPERKSMSAGAALAYVNKYIWGIGVSTQDP